MNKETFSIGFVSIGGPSQERIPTKVVDMPDVDLPQKSLPQEAFDKPKERVKTKSVEDPYSEEATARRRFKAMWEGIIVDSYWFGKAHGHFPTDTEHRAWNFEIVTEDKRHQPGRILIKYLGVFTDALSYIKQSSFAEMDLKDLRPVRILVMD